MWTHVCIGMYAHRVHVCAMHVCTHVAATFTHSLGHPPHEGSKHQERQRKERQAFPTAGGDNLMEKDEEVTHSLSPDRKGK